MSPILCRIWKMSQAKSHATDFIYSFKPSYNTKAARAGQRLISFSLESQDPYRSIHTVHGSTIKSSPLIAIIVIHRAVLRAQAIAFGLMRNGLNAIRSINILNFSTRKSDKKAANSRGLWLEMGGTY
jgi:hypothetical protein